ncbi:MAG: AraC family transcriptional regulator [Bacteroidales bacterium]|nr:AraC family transcriptional regulator [Bacteroidales bacterium]
MKLKICVHRTLRIFSIASGALLSLLDVLYGEGDLFPLLCVDLYCALHLLMLYPCSKSGVKAPLIAQLVSLSFFVPLKLLPLPLWAPVPVSGVILLFFVFRHSRERFKDVLPLFHSSAVWAGVEEYAALFHTAVFLFAGTLVFVLAGWDKAGPRVCLGLLAVLYVLEYYRVYTRTTLLISARKEEQIRRGQKGAGFKSPVQYVDSDSRSAELFNDVVRIMETKKPYLQDDFAVEDLARMTHTNRMYLSRSINFHSGRNFNQLVNYYRVKYAIELLKKDTGLRMTELSQMCGFHTVVSFNMAFKLNERMTPSEYSRSLKSSRLSSASGRLPSSSSSGRS